MENTLSKWLLLLCIILVLSMGCKKEFLDAKSSTSIIQPITLDDYESLLENQTTGYSPGLPTMSADEYEFIDYSKYQNSSTATERNSYTWDKDIFAGETAGGDWSVPYEAIFYSNNVLKGIESIYDAEKDKTRLNFIKGWALFNRAFAYYELVSSFSATYDANSANKDLGVPIKLNPSIEDIQPRSTVQQTYNQILSDLKQATHLLPSVFPQANRNRPSKVASHALLARIYLSMRKYDLAELEADSSLQLYSKLIDYNTVSKTGIEPFTKINDELILRKATTTKYSTPSVYINKIISIKPEFLASYEPNDLRFNLYFMQNVPGFYCMKLNYNGFTALMPFTGLATDEIYLIKAECAARRQDIPTALIYLNDLLVNRYATNKFTPVTASTPTEAINKVLLERRKELIWRNLRWSDLKRLNKEGANITLVRVLNGKTYTLPPNDIRYVFPIPDNEINQSRIQQNLR